MKKLLICSAFALGALASVAPAQAGGHGGWHGGWRGGWGVPFVAGAVIGAGVYAASTYPGYGYPYGYAAAPTVIYEQPTTVVVPAPAAAPAAAPRTAYYCPASQQFYPTAPACPVAWQAVNVY